MTSRGSFNLVIMFLGATLLFCLAGVIYLTATHNAIPDTINLLAASALSGLIGLLAKTPTDQGSEKNDVTQEVRVIRNVGDRPQEVHVMNEKHDAVPVEGQDGTN